MPEPPVPKSTVAAAVAVVVVAFGMKSCIVGVDGTIPEPPVGEKWIEAVYTDTYQTILYLCQAEKKNLFQFSFKHYYKDKTY